MISLLARLLIPDSQDMQSPRVRRAYGVLCGAVGIGLNLLLFLGKWVAGLLSGSIAITADAFNNLSDAGSSLITLIGFHLSGQKPDPEHPFGHGRMEYISGLLVSVAILLMGFELIQSSVGKIRAPEPIESSPLVLGILAGSILVKLYMSCYNRSIGRKIDSPAMAATAADSLGDMVSTALVLAATLISQATGLLLDGWFGLLVGVFILIGGLRAMKDTIDPLLGQAPDPALVAEIQSLVLAHPMVHGIHDLIVHDYGPGRRIVSLHAEVPAEGSLLSTHEEIDRIEWELRERLNCPAIIHMDPVVTQDWAVNQLHTRVSELARQIDPRLTIHDFRLVEGAGACNLIFDLAVPYDCKSSDGELSGQLARLVEEQADRPCRAIIQVDRV